MAESAFTAFPAAGTPGGSVNRSLRADFRPVTPGTAFDTFIERKTPRLGWARAIICPCESFNDQTLQPSPNCPKCDGRGFQYFRPDGYAVDTKELGKFNDEQTATLDRARAVAIRGLLVSVTAQPTLFHALGRWGFGTASLTVRPANRLSQYDRIIQIDELMAFTERMVVDESGSLKTKYRVVSLNRMQSLVTDFDDTDVRLENGLVTWRSGKKPAKGTVVSVHYNCHPVWVCWHHLHLTRTSLAAFRQPKSKRQTPEGNTVPLPMQMLCYLEHLEGSIRELGEGP